jgi:hypothetical protein
MIKSEFTSWAWADTLEPVEEVPSADGKKMVKATLTQARKLGLLPRTTSIISELTNFTLVEYQKEECIKACIAFPFDRPDEEEEIETYIRMIKAKADEFKNFTANRGKEIHAQVGKWLESGQDTDDGIGKAAILRIGQWLKSVEATKVTTEQSLGGKKFGFAGTPDMVVETPGGRIIADIKTTSFKKFRKPYDGWMLQLGAYSILTESDPSTQLVSLVIDRDFGDTKVLPYDEPERWREAFRHLFEVWVGIKGYDPRKDG